jgi:hypothetical protein
MSDHQQRVSIGASLFLQNIDAEREWVPIPELAPKDDPDPTRYGVWVRAISAGEHERLTKTSVVFQGRGKNAQQKFDMPTFRVKLATIAMVNEDGSRMFREDQYGQVAAQSARVIERVSDVALRLCNTEDDTQDEDGEDAPKAASNGTTSTEPLSTYAPFSEG